MEDLRGAMYFAELDLLLRYWLMMPLAPEDREVFLIVTSEGVYSPTSVLRGARHATTYFQGTMARLLTGLK